ncbi:decaprenyl-phosphate phosphoribosyltransferase [soil metagenome]
MKDFLRLIRVHQWVKNFFLYVPAFFGGVLINQEIFKNLTIGFFAFSFVTSAVYILNDYKDIEKDKLHPEKKDRPLASGAVDKKQALVIFILMLLAGLTIAYFLNFYFFLITLFYFIMNIAYTLRLKDTPIIDVSIISTGFLLRIFAGGVISEVIVSKWLILLTFLLAMLLALAKRRSEYKVFLTGKKIRKSIKGYNLDFINVSMVMMASVTVVSYIMYTVSIEVIQRIGNDYLYITSFFVIMGIMRYLQLTLVYDRSGSPTKVLLKDKMTQILILGWIFVFVILLYVI